MNVRYVIPHIMHYLCHALIIYIHSTSIGMSMTCSHLGIDDHPLANDTCCGALDMAFDCFAIEVLELPTTKI